MIEKPEMEDARWHRVYFAAIAFTILLIAGLWGFSRLFS